ncbi:hypothetical protein E4T48_08223 [Aureobasidium sp. EXF-10727]|nr:hypothetical protein E4T48_08223 [Aureobasidium sp. EXF-10727]
MSKETYHLESPLRQPALVVPCTFNLFHQTPKPLRQLLNFTTISRKRSLRIKSITPQSAIIIDAIFSMDKLPLELKQHICSFLHASPKLLKPIRLVSKQFASAASPYLLPRIFLLNHPDSCDEVQRIIEHPVFSKYVTTIVVDINRLEHHDNLEHWIDNHEDLQDEFPTWWQFKPQDVEYDEDGDPILTTFSSRASWSQAMEKFKRALENATRSIKELSHIYWTTQKHFAVHVQSDADFKSRFWKMVADAFEACPSLTNLVVAPPHHFGATTERRNRVFKTCLATHNSFVTPADHIPPEFGLKDILQATKNLKGGLNSLTIVDFPIDCAGCLTSSNLFSVGSLKHIRIGYNRLNYNPTDFGFDLQQVLNAAQSLETFWIEMPPRIVDEYEADGLLQSINSEHFRDILLDNAVVSEDSMVSFLLRHADSLQQLDLGVTVNPGTWVSTFKRISTQLRVLRRIQLVSLCEIQASEKVGFSPQWCSEARAFIISGGQLSEPVGFDLSTEFEGIVEEPLRNYDAPENGLWSDYDMNAFF